MPAVSSSIMYFSAKRPKILTASLGSIDILAAVASSVVDCARMVLVVIVVLVPFVVVQKGDVKPFESERKPTSARNRRNGPTIFVVCLVAV